MDGAEVVRHARNYIGVKFRHHGRDKNGVDCAGLIIAVAKELGLDAVCGYVDKRDYPRQPTNSNMMKILRCNLRHVKVGTPQAGDVLHFVYRRIPQHVGIYTGNDNQIIHVIDGRINSVIEISYDMKWQNRLHSIYRFKGVN